MSKFRVEKSNVIDQPFTDFVTIMHENAMKELGLENGSYVILENELKKIKIASPIISRKHKLVNEELRYAEDVVCLDQTYREALKIKPEEFIIITSMKTKRGIKEKFLNWMKFQQNVVRVLPNSTYMERKTMIICICEEMINSIGAKYGDEIIIESVKESKHQKIRGLCAPLTPAMQKIHDDSTELKNTENEILVDIVHPVFIDDIGRKKLGIQKGCPIKIRRSTRWTISKKLNELGSFGLVALSIIGSAFALHPDNTILFIFTSILGCIVGYGILTASKFNTIIRH